jgi:hypothetical protein
LSAKDGPLGGLLIYDDPNGASAPAIPAVPLPIPVVGGLVEDLFKGPPREHKILSDNARMLLGTIYMPHGRLIIDAKRPHCASPEAPVNTLGRPDKLSAF